MASSFHSCCKQAEYIGFREVKVPQIKEGNNNTCKFFYTWKSWFSCLVLWGVLYVFIFILPVIDPFKELCIRLSPPISYRRFDLLSFRTSPGSLEQLHTAHLQGWEWSLSGVPLSSLPRGQEGQNEGTSQTLLSARQRNADCPEGNTNMRSVGFVLAQGIPPFCRMTVFPGTYLWRYWCNRKPESHGVSSGSFSKDSVQQCNSAEICRMSVGASPQKVQVMQQPHVLSLSAIPSNAWVKVTNWGLMTSLLHFIS